MIAELLAFVGVVVAVAAPMCGHQSQPWPLKGACAWLCGRLAASRPSQAPFHVECATGPLRPHTALRAPRVPSWATQQPITYEEAA